MIKVFHSDRGGDKEHHKIILKAYKILSDPVQKLVFDNYGNIGLLVLNEKPDNKIKILESILSDPKITIEERKIAKDYLMFKIDKQIKTFEMLQKTRNKEYNTILSSNMSFTHSILIFDYLFSKYIYHKHQHKFQNIILPKNMAAKSLSFDEQILLSFSKDQSHSLFLKSNVSFYPKKFITSENFSLLLNKKINIPTAIFEQRFIDSETEIKYKDEKNISVSQEVALGNFVVKGSYNFKRKTKELILGFQWNNVQNSFLTSLKYKIWATKLKCYSIYRFSDNEKLSAMLNLSPKEYEFGGTYATEESKDISKQYMLLLRDNMVMLSNELSYHLKFFNVDFKSSLNLMKGQDNTELSSIFSIGLKFKRFRLQLPFIVSNSNPILSILTLGLSSLIGYGCKYLHKMWKRYNSKHKNLFDKINSVKQEDFNSRLKEIYLSKLEKEKAVNGLEIMFAYFGEFSCLEEIYRIINIFGDYTLGKTDQKIFDVKIPLSLIIVGSKLVLPKNLTDIEGIFIPNFQNANNLGLIIKYKYQMITNTILLKNNNSTSLEIPFTSANERKNTDN